MSETRGPFQFTRRDFLIHGARAGAALTFSQSLGVTSLLASPQAKAKSVILLWMAGGPSQIDTFDPKPGASTGGEFKAISTSVPGIQICEHLPLLAGQIKDLAIIRSMHSTESNHDRARYYGHTGYAPAEATQHPSFGGLVANQLMMKSALLPAYASINGPALGYGGDRFAPFVIRDPNEPFQHLKRRKASSTTHFRYGNTEIGAGCLMARRLVESGVRFVQVEMGGWDTHEDNFNTTRNLLQHLDPAFSSLIADLRSSGLLDSTLVVWMGEFGRTPRINAKAGRDHWPSSWCAVVAGGGIKGGQVIGCTDNKGYEITDNPVGVPDLHATICACLGIDDSRGNHGAAIAALI